MTMTPRPWDAPEITGWRRMPMHALRHRGGDPGVARLELDGVWRFELFPTPVAALAATGVPRAELDVPACWTTEPFADVHGVGDRPHYTNVQMPWPDRPPHPPALNPTGVYEREVLVPAEWAGRRVVLHVGAAESVLLVQVDGVDVGVSKDSHLAAEFDLTGVLRPGVTARLRLIVVKWSDASFIEDQDQWWHGGITRSVFLYATAPVHLADVRVTAGLDRDPAGGVLLGTLAVDVDVAGPDGADRAAGWWVEACLEGWGEPVRAEVPSAAGTARVRLAGRVANVHPWSPESPRLYDLTVTLHRPDSSVVEGTRLRVGFRDVRIVGNDLLVNGVRFLIRGVNRHDVDPVGGRVVTAEDVREELLLLKRFGFNALRTSHYPNDPVLLDLADEFGLFVVAEADLECHAYPQLSDDPQYLTAFLDRVTRLVRRDGNHPSVIAWSLGNESGHGAAHDAAAGWVHRFDPSRPVHYEGAVAPDWDALRVASDLTCPMYPTIDEIVGHARSGRQRRPLVMCEYSHAMGNSNGSLADYWHAIESTPGLQGGFIWELRDHALLQRLSDGRPPGRAEARAVTAGSTAGSGPGGTAPRGYRWAYGGDFGDVPHDGAFVVDGLTFPDRTPKPALWEHRQLAAPVRLYPGGRWGEVVIENHQHVRDLSWLRGQWQVIADGAVRRPAVARTAPAHLPALRPGARTVVQVPPELLTEVTGTAGGSEAWLTLRLITAIDEPWAPAGSPVAPAQVLLRPEQRSLLERAGAGTGSGTDGVEVDGDGLLVHPRLAAAPRLALWRAPTDNDRIAGLADRWQDQGLDRLTRTLLGVDTEGGRTVVRSRYRAGGGAEIEHTHVLTALASDGGRGGVLVEETAVIPAELADLPRVGTVFEVPAELRWVDWFGAGPWETYPDRRTCAEIGGFGSDVGLWFTPYVRPQESGGRCGVRWFALSAGADDQGRYADAGIGVHCDQPRQVSLARYRASDLATARHHDELVARPQIVVHLDAAHRGVGTASCGPDTLPAYRLGPGIYRWSWTLTTV